MSRKKARKAETPHSSKTPRIDPSLKPSIDDSPVWRVSTLDMDGPWGWENIDKTHFFKRILPKIQNFESMMWKEILGRDSHPVNVEQISKAAQKRLTELRLDDFQTLVSLRFTGKERLWGVKSQNILKIIWWDPNHEVYPSLLKHT